MEQVPRLKDAEKAVIRELREGDRTKGAIVEFTDLHRNTIYQALQRLEALRYIGCVHRDTALYTLKNDPLA